MSKIIEKMYKGHDYYELIEYNTTKFRTVFISFYLSAILCQLGFYINHYYFNNPM